MTTPDLFDEQIKHRLTELFPSENPSPQLSRRIDGLTSIPAQEAYQKAKQQKALLPCAIVWGLFMLALFLTGWLGTLSPPIETEFLGGATEFLGGMDGAMMGVHSEHIVIYNVQPNGDRIKAGEVWYQNGKDKVNVYEEGMTETQLVRDGKRWTYTPSDNTVVIEGQNSSSKALTTNVAFTDGLKSSEFGQNPVVKDLGETIFSSRPRHQVEVIVNPDTQFIFSLDPETDLPFHKELRRRSGGRWATRSTWDFEYNRALPDTLFLPDFPKNAHVIDKCPPPGRQRQ